MSGDSVPLSDLILAAVSGAATMVPIINRLRRGVFVQPYSSDYRRQLTVTGKWAEVPQIKTVSNYRQNPRRDERSRGKKREDNINRMKPDSERKMAKPVEKSTENLSELTRLNQTANKLTGFKKLGEFKQKMPDQITKETNELSKLQKAIRQSEEQESQIGTNLAHITNQLDGINRVLNKLNEKKTQTEKLLANAEAMKSNLDTNAILKFGLSEAIANFEVKKMEIMNQEFFKSAFTEKEKKLETLLTMSKESNLNKLVNGQEKMSQSQEVSVLIENKLKSIRQGYENLMNNDSIQILKVIVSEQTTDQNVIQKEEINILANFTLDLPTKSAKLPKKINHESNASDEKPFIQKNIPKKEIIHKINEILEINEAHSILTLPNMMKSFVDKSDSLKIQQHISFIYCFKKVLQINDQKETLLKYFPDIIEIYDNLGLFINKSQSHNSNIAKILNTELVELCAEIDKQLQDLILEICIVNPENNQELVKELKMELINSINHRLSASDLPLSDIIKRKRYYYVLVKQFALNSIEESK